MSIRSKIRGAKMFVAKRKLESELNKTVDLMNGHKEAGLPAGHKHYQVLLARAQAAVKKYQDRAAKLNAPVMTYENIEADVPTLRELRELASNEASPASRKAVGVAIGVMLATFVVTFVLAMDHNLYLYLTHWANVHWLVRP